MATRAGTNGIIARANFLSRSTTMLRSLIVLAIGAAGLAIASEITTTPAAVDNATASENGTEVSREKRQCGCGGLSNCGCGCFQGCIRTCTPACFTPVCIRGCMNTCRNQCAPPVLLATPVNICQNTCNNNCMNTCRAPMCVSLCNNHCLNACRPQMPCLTMLNGGGCQCPQAYHLCGNGCCGNY